MTGAAAVPNVRPLSVERARALLGAEADGLSDDEVRAIALAVSRHVAMAFDLALRPSIAKSRPEPCEGAERKPKHFGPSRSGHRRSERGA